VFGTGSHLASQLKNGALCLREVGTEELPASFVDDAIEQWRSRIPSSLKEHLTTEAIDFTAHPDV